jgi:hypothetical protein
MVSERHACRVAAENAVDAAESNLGAADDTSAGVYALLAIAERLGQLAEAVERYASAYEANT